MRMTNERKKHNGAGLKAAAVFFAVALLFPLQARAADCCAATIMMLEKINQTINKLSVANSGGQRLLNEQLRRQADYDAQIQSNLQRQSVTSNAMINYPMPHDYACSTATLNQSNQTRAVRGDIAMDRVAASLASLYTDPDSGNQIYQQRIFNASCKLGAVGSGVRDRHGTVCETPAVASLKDRDISLVRAIIKDLCIPFDPSRVVQEFSRAVSENNYSPADPETREGVLAMIYIHRLSRIDQEAYPKKEAFKTAAGLYKGTLITDSLARRNAPQGALLDDLDYHACYSKAYMPGCQKGDEEARQYLLEKFTPAEIDLPPNGYCLSMAQLSIAKQIKNEKTQMTYVSGTDAQAIAAYAALDNANAALVQERALVDGNASLAVHAMAENISPQATRQPMQAADNAGQPELVDMVKNLTRSIEKRNLQEDDRPHVSKAAAKSAAAHILPPIRSDYPVLSE